MSKTGHYRYIDGKWTKVSDKPGTFHDAYVPRDGYFDETLGSPVEVNGVGTGGWRPAEIRTKSQKAALMKEKGLVEDGGFRKETRRKYFHA